MYKYFKQRNFEWGNLMLFFSRDLSVDEKNVYMEALAFILNVGKSNNDAKKEYMETQMAETGLSKKDFRAAKKVKTAGELAKDTRESATSKSSVLSCAR